MSRVVLPLAFFERDAREVAPELLGKLLHHESPDGVTSGLIVETEAYLGAEDPAAHSFKKPTPRTQAMFEAPGTWYVYRIYGLHLCINIVCGKKGSGQAVLLRALEPVEGLEIMRQRRHLNPQDPVQRLAKGPGLLTQAMGITMNYNHQLMSDTTLTLRTTSTQASAASVIQTTRVGLSVATELPYRWYLSGNKYVSRTGG